jgi:hypothetical protein
MQCSKRPLVGAFYSITSSARASTDGGTSADCQNRYSWPRVNAASKVIVGVCLKARVGRRRRFSR